MNDEHTLYGMRASVSKFPASLLLHELLELLILSLQLLDSLVMVVYCSAKDLLSSLLPDYKLIKVFFQHPRCDSGCTNNAGAPQRACRRLSSFVDARKWLVVEVRAVELPRVRIHRRRGDSSTYGK